MASIDVLGSFQRGEEIDLTMQKAIKQLEDSKVDMSFFSDQIETNTGLIAKLQSLAGDPKREQQAISERLRAENKFQAPARIRNRI